jgi:tyrosyl-tRNA synthetase
LPLAEIARLEQLRNADINAAKELLATEATRLCHGDEAAREAAATAALAFAGGVAEGLLTYTLKGDEPVLIIDVAFDLGILSSKSEGRRLVEQGGLRLNDQPVRTARDSIRGSDLGESGTARLSVGKKRHALIRRG